MRSALLPLLLTAVALQAGCASLHGDDMDGAFGKTAHGIGSLLDGIGEELRTRIWRSDPGTPTSLPSAQPPSPGQ